MKKRWLKLFLYSFIITFSVLALSGTIYYVSATLLIDPAGESIRKGQEALADNRLDDAEKYFKRALKSNETSTDGRVGLADVYVKKGQIGEAVNVLKEGISLSLGVYEYYEKIIRIYTENNMIAEARSFINAISNQFVSRKLRDNMPASVTASPEPGQYDKAISVKLSSSEGAKIYYTTDGSQPTLQSTLYDGKSISVKETITLRAFAVNDKMILSETELSASYIVVQTNKKYTFVDPKVETIVRAMLNVPDGDVTYKQILSIRKFTNIDAAGNPFEGAITRLDDILQMKNLSELTLAGEQMITDYSGLSSLPVLRTLTLRSCGINDTTFKAIASNTMLISLDLSQNTISDITQISGMNNLSYLSLSNNMIADFTPLSALTSLKTLDISKNLASDISALSTLGHLNELKADNNQITDFSPVCSLSSLARLDLSDNQIMVVPDMARLTALTELDLSGNNVANLVPLAVCGSLDSLDISRNAVYDLAPLSNLRLTRLIASDNHIPSLAPVASMRQLKILDVSGNYLSDISPLASLPQLESLYISRNDIWDVSGLGSISSLREIYCSDIPADDYSAINTQVVRVYR